jgi:phosphoglucosamine mutase
VLVNVRVREKPNVASLPAVAQAIAEAEAQLGDRGRVLVRYSGTEPLLRVMLEGEVERQIRDLADGIAACVQAAIGRG